jgi:branched-chain amino acid aminotransferase
VHQFLLHNGQIHETNRTLISAGQVGFLNGWGVFSTIRVASRVLFAFERHYRRMRQDAGRLRVPFAISAEQLEFELLKLVEANGVEDATLRVAVVRNRGGIWEGAGITRDSDLIAFTTDLTDWGAGVKLMYKPNARFSVSPFSGAKVTSWAENLAWYEEAHEHGFDEYILLNEKGEVSECTSANVFVIDGSEVWTPPLGSSGCLPGVTRGLLLEEIHVPGLHIGERALTPSDLEAADQVFITSTTRDLLPVTSIDNEPLSQNPVRLSCLSRAFAEYRQAYTASHARRTELLSQ